MLGDCPDHFLSNGSPWLHVICTHIQLRDFSFRPCYKAHTLPSSKLEDYVGTMHLPVHHVLPVQQFGFFTKL